MQENGKIARNHQLAPVESPGSPCYNECTAGKNKSPAEYCG